VTHMTFKIETTRLGGYNVSSKVDWDISGSAPGPKRLGAVANRYNSYGSSQIQSTRLKKKKTSVKLAGWQARCPDKKDQKKLPKRSMARQSNTKKGIRLNHGVEKGGGLMGGAGRAGRLAKRLPGHRVWNKRGSSLKE